MQKTETYQLNQWDATDRILREDFNADNAKIEAALQAIRDLLPIVHLQTITITAATTNLDIDLSGFDWDTYTFALIRIDGTMNSSSASFYVRMNGYSGEYNYYSGNAASINSASYACYCYLGSGSTLAPCLMLVSSQGSYPEIKCRRLGYTSESCGFLNKSETLTKLSLVGTSSSYTISSGTKIEIYGIKL